MDEPIPQQIRKGICLVIWREGRGRIGKTVTLSLEEMIWRLNAIGIRVSAPSVKTALTANIKASWIERTRFVEQSTDTHEYKLSESTRQRAQELAVEIGTDLLPPVPKAAHAVPIDAPAITINSKETDNMPAETPSPDSDQQFIDRMLNVLVRASEAQKAIERAEQLEAQLQDAALPVDAVNAIKSSVAVLEWIGSLGKTPLGMILDEKFCGDHDTPVTASSRVLANAITRHFPDMAVQK